MKYVAKKNDEQHWGVVRGSKPDELTHWKYIKRYKKNGKWRYVYGDDKTHRDIKSNRDLAGISDKNYKYEQGIVDWATSALNERRRMGLSTDGSLERTIKIHKEKAKPFEETRDYYNAQADKIISKNSVKTLSKKQINKGKKKVESLLKRLR